MAGPVSQISNIARTIQLAVAPVFMLAGIGSFLTSRLGRVAGRSRFLVEQHRSNMGDRGQRLAELRVLDNRVRLASIAIWLCTASALMICFVVGGLFLADLARLGITHTMAVGFVLAMLLLVFGLLVFLVEVHVAYRQLRISDELLERKLR